MVKVRAGPLSWVRGKGKVSGVLEPNLSIFDQKRATLTVNAGPSPVRATLVVVADFTEQ